MHKIVLEALEASNLLAYLAALGTLRTLALEESDAVALGWIRRSWVWRPVLHHAQIASGEDLVKRLAKLLDSSKDPNPAFTIKRDLTFEPGEFRQLARRALEQARPSDRSFADFLAAFGCEAYLQNNEIALTALRTMSGAGHQHFLKTMAELHRNTEVRHLTRALLIRWDYADPRLTMRWDPNDFRPHALRALDPSKDTPRTMHGANRLALEALPLFPTIPCAGGLGTVAFRRRGEIREWEVSWPVWQEPLDVGSICALLSLKELQEPAPSRGVLAARGVVQVYRARRFTEGMHRNFSPARELL